MLFVRNPNGQTSAGCSSYTSCASALSVTSSSVATPTITGSVSGSTLRISYTNLPANSYVQILNAQTGNVQASGVFEVSNISGSGEITKSISDIPQGNYALRVRQSADGSIQAYQVVSPTFVVGGTNI